MLLTSSVSNFQEKKKKQKNVQIYLLMWIYYLKNTNIINQIKENEGIKKYNILLKQLFSKQKNKIIIFLHAQVQKYCIHGGKTICVKCSLR